MENEEEFEGVMIEVTASCVSCGNSFGTYTNTDTGVYDDVHCEDCREQLDL